MLSVFINHGVAKFAALLMSVLPARRMIDVTISQFFVGALISTMVALSWLITNRSAKQAALSVISKSTDDNSGVTAVFVGSFLMSIGCCMCGSVPVTIYTQTVFRLLATLSHDQLGSTLIDSILRCSVLLAGCVLGAYIFSIIFQSWPALQRYGLLPKVIIDDRTRLWIW